MAVKPEPKKYPVREFEYTIDQIRTMGMGENFYVDNPEDGYRKDGTLWFGECTQCRQRVTSSYIDGVIWKHTVEVPNRYNPNSTTVTTKTIDYCPANPLG